MHVPADVFLVGGEDVTAGIILQTTSVMPHCEERRLAKTGRQNLWEEWAPLDAVGSGHWLPPWSCLPISCCYIIPFLVFPFSPLHHL
uniref:Uncharacterized protein n=1 Tax=Steinernema glaseri TaxID=37863 RepID=A0A1I7ZL17_9BILA